MASSIEQIIDEIEEYIENCKPYPLSSAKIIVNKEGIEDLITELRNRAPEEIKRYQKVISNKEAILADAQAKAEMIIAQAQVRTDELMNEHQIMQRAYGEADAVVSSANTQAQRLLADANTQAENLLANAQRQAQEMIDDAANTANNMRMGAVQYTNDLLRHVEDAIARAMEASKVRHDTYLAALQDFYTTVSSNRAELDSVIVESVPEENIPDEFSDTDVSSDMLD